MVIVDLGITEKFILPFLINKRKFSILIIKNAYDLIIIDRNLLLSQNRRVDKKRNYHQP